MGLRNTLRIPCVAAPSKDRGAQQAADVQQALVTQRESATHDHGAPQAIDVQQALVTPEPSVQQTSTRVPWNGVNLGGWLLLEPGPSYPLFTKNARRDGGEAECEWELMVDMRQADASMSKLQRHRDTFIGRKDFEKIKQMGLNAVRLPVGYWIVLGPQAGEPFVGPALEYVDRAVNWAEEFGLQVLLDLHGCPGGESGEVPCGRKQADGKWSWKQWDFTRSLEALRVLASRYCDRACVTGVAVCNEPSNSVPNGSLCNFYSRAIKVVRAEGMTSSRVTVVLPVFQRPIKGFATKWEALGGGAFDNICFDLHLYHCFEDDWNGKNFAQHLRAVEENAEVLQKYPAVVGEWSIALGRAAYSCPLARRKGWIQAAFGGAQLVAYKQASHGWFFWNWKDGAGSDWDWQKASKEGWFARAPRKLPVWDGKGEDPLEEELDPSPPGTSWDVCFGDTIFLRAFHGNYVDVEGTRARARWNNRGEWQRFVVRPPVGVLAEENTKARAVLNGDTIRLIASSGRALSVTRNGLVGASLPKVAGLRANFVVRTEGTATLRHRGGCFLVSRANSLTIDVDSACDAVKTRWTKKSEKGNWYSNWQQYLVVEKSRHNASSKSTCLKRALISDQEGRPRKRIRQKCKVNVATS